MTLAGPRVQNVQHDVRYNFMSQCIDLRHVGPVRWVGLDVVGRSRIIKSRMMPGKELADVDHAYAFLPGLFQHLVGVVEREILHFMRKRVHEFVVDAKLRCAHRVRAAPKECREQRTRENRGGIS